MNLIYQLLHNKKQMFYLGSAILNVTCLLHFLLQY